MAGGSSYRYTKRSKKNDNDGLVWMLTIIIAVCFFLVVGFFKLIGNFFKWIGNLASQNKSKSKTEYNRTTAVKTPLIIKPKELNKYIDEGPIVTYKEKTLKVPSVHIKTPYDDLFMPQIRERGKNYFKENKVNKYKFNDQICSAEIVGNANYETTIVFYKNKNIKNASCTCPYHKKDNEYCKHIYALLLEYCEREKVEGYINNKTYKERKQKESIVNNNYYNRMIDICNSMKEIITNAEEFYNSCDELEDIDIDDIYNEILEYKDKINEYGNTKITELSDKLIETAKEDLYEMENLYDNLILEFETIIENKEEQQAENEELEGLMTYYALNEINNKKIKEKELEEYELERKELRNTWGLSEHEIDEVQKGNYEPWQFDEEELEEDDYYYEDDL